MEFTIYKPEDFKTTTWSGGTTTQLFIYPPTADYQQRNFDFRISTAKVETEKSSFTSLPDVSRKIMILDGGINISHENHYSKLLNKFDIDEFEGDWKTSAVGTCTDFNVMTTGNTKSELSASQIEENQNIEFSMDESRNWLFIYVYSGKINVRLENKNYDIYSGNLLLIKNLQKKVFQLLGLGRSELILVKMWNKNLDHNQVPNA